MPVAQAGEKTVKYKFTGPIIKREVVLVPDVKGHAIGVLERRGVAIYVNGEVAAYDIPGICTIYFLLLERYFFEIC